MAKQYLFRIDLLNKKDFNPLNMVAYYSGQVQLNAFNKEKFQPDPKKQVLYCNLVVPTGDLYAHLPDYLKISGKKKEIIDNARNSLWKKVDFFETRMDSQFARIFEVSVPAFLSLTEAQQLVEEYGKILSEYGMVVDVSIHKTNTANNNILSQDAAPTSDDMQDYSCFFMCTLRPFKEGNFENKNRDWNKLDQLVVWRHTWVNLLKSKIATNLSDEEVKKSWEQKLEFKPKAKIKM